MSKLTNTKRAYDKLGDLLDQEIRKRSGNVRDLEEIRKFLDVAFYMLGWAHFEHLVREHAAEIVETGSRSKSNEGHAWRYLKQNLRGVPLRVKLELIFAASPTVLASLHKDYDVRNEAAHDYKIPSEAKDISSWLDRLEALVDKFK